VRLAHASMGGMCDSPEENEPAAEAVARDDAPALPQPCRFAGLDSAVATESAAGSEGCAVILALDVHGGRTLEVSLSPLAARQLCYQLAHALAKLEGGVR